MLHNQMHILELRNTLIGIKIPMDVCNSRQKREPVRTSKLKIRSIGALNYRETKRWKISKENEMLVLRVKCLMCIVEIPEEIFCS